MAEFNVSSLFTSGTKECLLTNAKLSDKDDSALTAARDIVRDALRIGLPEALSDPRTGKRIKTPKFVTQGSHKYKTILAPLRPPQQQADLDDGVYIRLGDVSKNGRPSLVSATYVEASDAILSAVAKRHGWDFHNTNPNCARLVLADKRKHIDVPRYAMPDQEFERLITEAAALRKALATDGVMARTEDDDNWDVIPEGVILAHRDRDWIKSDPRPLYDWIVRQVAMKGEELRMIIKIVKSWRDFQIWPNARDPKSILLMVAMDIAKWKRISGRFDLTLLGILEQLPAILSGTVNHPVPGGSEDEERDLAKRLDSEGIRAEVVARVSTLATDVKRAIFGASSPEDAVAILRGQFGDRIPNDPERVIRATVEAAPAIITSRPERIPATRAGGRSG